MNITTDNFQDYGIIDWFDQSKGFGVVQSVRNGEVFIHKNHGISGEAENGKIALIGSISINSNRNNRVYGNNVEVWDKEETEVYELIYKKLIDHLLIHSLSDIKWLINYGSLAVNKKLSEKLSAIEDFEKELLNVIYGNRARLKGVYDDVVLSKWAKKGEFKYDIYLEAFFSRYYHKLRHWEPVVPNSHHHNKSKPKERRFPQDIKQEETVNLATIRLDFGDDFIKKLLNVNQTWILDKKFSGSFRKLKSHIKSSICKYIINDLFSDCRDFLSNDNANLIKWIFEYAEDSILRELIGKTTLTTNPLMAQLLREDSHWQLEKEKSRFLINYWKSNENKVFDDNVAWLLKHADEDIIDDTIKSNKENWINDSAFIEAIKNQTYSTYSPAVLSFIQEVCCEKRVADANFDWLMEFGDIDAIKQVISHLTGYKLEVLEAIHLALFPNNNKNYFIEKAKAKNWSFEWKYDLDQQERIKNLFNDLFKPQLRITPSDVPIKDIYKKQTHSATDLASFTFCPASYVLTQTYDLNFSEQENIYIGQKEHDKKRLLNIGTITISPDYPRITKNETFSQLVSRIRISDCLFNGHGDKLEKPFYSKNKKLSSIPDYIFQDKDGIFIVEEKYTFKKPEQVNNLYDNHKIQALTYLYGLEDFKPSAAYVCYWFIEKEDDNFKILEAKAFGLVRSEGNKNALLKVYNAVEALQKREPYPFPANQINYNKCVRCNYFPYCDYKTGDKSWLNLPPLPLDETKGK